MNDFFNFVNNMEVDPFIINLRQQYFELLLFNYIKKQHLSLPKKTKTRFIDSPLQDSYITRPINITINLTKPEPVNNNNDEDATQVETQPEKPQMPDLGELNFDLFFN